MADDDDYGGFAGCCPSCCKCPDFGNHDNCVPCDTSQCCVRSLRRNYARLQRQAEKSAASRRGSRVPPDEKGVAKEAKTQETVAGEGKTSSEHGKPVAGKDKESPRKRRCGTRKCGSSKGKSSGSKSK